MKTHPNFPDRLNIKPSLAPGLPQTGKDENTSAFDSESQSAAIEKYGIAGRVWEAAYLLTQYFEPAPQSDWGFDPPCSMISEPSLGEPLTVIELGSGTGFVGLSLVKQLQQVGVRDSLVIVTDLPDVCRLLENNLHVERQKWNQNTPTDVWVKPLAWGGLSDSNQLAVDLGLSSSNPALRRHPTHLICSDLVYFPHLLAPLLRSLLHLTSPPFAPMNTTVTKATNNTTTTSPEIIVSYEIRSLPKESPFWSAFGLWFSYIPLAARRKEKREGTKMDVSVDVDPSRFRGKWRRFGDERRDADGHAFVFIARRRPESYAWRIPDDDTDLLAGVGARGTQYPKSDDTFEMLLLMTMDDESDDDA
ncbi:hypothetical protein BD410DRAFT_819865 [Rickenella mellea]|uniref:S-adenosyl-L-methionine-dependent methyltransferase n=1 Tax=Rickenella mellea TaxID=50990 RepID=A0A4Y7QEW7_9AGAM|nr:hypothetical protein BD410DRAFT_819865 [Rickenella mellea]